MTNDFLKKSKIKGSSALHFLALPLTPMKWLGLPLIVAAVLGMGAPAAAHPAPFSFLDVRIHSTAVDLTLVAHIFDLAHELGIDPPERLLDPAVLGRRRSA